jgi:PAS domain S-box-containing protein
VSAAGPIRRLLSQVSEVPTQAEAQRGLREVLGDPTLELLWVGPGGVYVDTDGRSVALDDQPTGRAVTPITHEQRAVGALIHDPSLLDEPALDEVAAVIGLAIEKDQINAQLREQRDLLSAIGDGTPALLCLTFADGRILPDGTNRALRDLVGAAREELAGHLFWDMLVVETDRAEVERVIGSVAAGEPQPERVSRWRSTTGAISVAWTCAPLLEIESTPIFLISGVDVSDLERQAQELRDSRSRIVLAADNERRRLERNLHDGAQQRLVSLSLSLRRAEKNVVAAPDQAVEVLRAASEELVEAIADLRELARGLHPAILTDRGLRPALAALAERAPLPVTVEGDVPERLPAPVEAAAYFVAAEALTNAARHAHATRAVIEVELARGRLTIAVADDGVGGAAADKGTGLRGLSDRVEAIAGSLAVTSDGLGTRVTASMPAEARPAAAR